jgi:hypothetical protein
MGSPSALVSQARSGLSGLEHPGRPIRLHHHRLGFYTAQMRWICRHIEGTRREVVFKASGLQYLWRVLVAALACSFIIPIPWMFRWIVRWQASQTVLVERTA